MSDYKRSIGYIYEVKKEGKGRNVGFIKIQQKNGIGKLSVRLKIGRECGEEKFYLYLFRQNRDKEQERICIGNLRPYEENVCFRTQVNAEHVENTNQKLDEVEGLVITGESGSVRFYCDLDKCVREKMVKEEDNVLKTAEVTIKKEDRWENLIQEHELHTYESDGMEYVKIGPENLTALPEKFQVINKNSFLMHGFYHYRYLILGKAKKMGNPLGKPENQYIIGVPGIYRRNERMMADMFGFTHYLKTPKEEVEGYWCQKINL